MTAMRGVAGRVIRLRTQLGERDVAVLSSLRRFRLLSTDHVQRLHTATGSQSSQLRRTQAQLQRLTTLGLVVRLGRSIGGQRAGSRGYLYGLTGLGLAVLDLPGYYGKRRRVVWVGKPYFQDHLLAVSETYVQLVEHCRAGEGELLSFDAEPTCWRRFLGAAGETAVLKPDGFTRIGVGDYELMSFVEVDLGSESLPTIQRKCQVYLHYWRSGLEQQRHGIFPRVVWLVPTTRRLTGIADVLRHITRDTNRDVFAVALAADGPRELTTLPTTTQGGAR